MKNKILLVMLLGILLIPFVNSAIELNRDSYKLGETVIAKLAFTYPPDKISTEHFGFYDENGKKISVNFYIVKFSDNRYYAYFTLPTILSQEKYKLSIGPYYYVLGGILKMNTDSVDINILDKKEPLLQVDPGAFTLDLDQQDTFYVELKNNGDSAMNLYLKLSDGTLGYNTYKLQQRGNLKLKGTLLSDGEKTLQIIYISEQDRNNISYEYDIPILATQKAAATPVATTPVVTAEKAPSDAIKFIDEKVDVPIISGQTLTGTIKFKNSWTDDIKNVQLSLTNDLSDVVTLDKTSFTIVGPEQINSVFLEINKNDNVRKDYSGELKLTSGDISASIPIAINYIEGPKATETKSIEEVQQEGTPTVQSEQQEMEKEKQLKSGMFFSIIAIIFVVAISVLIFLRSRKTKPRDFIHSRH